MTTAATQPVDDLDEGSTIGSYTILKQIGAGSMGLVYEAVHTMLPRHVAIKVLHAELLTNTVMASRMAQEASILDELEHPGIVRIYDCGRLADRRPWIAMELLSGGSLGATLERETTMSPSAVCKLTSVIADVLVAAHARGIVHRDLKPDNVLFATPDSECAVRIIDWGVALVGAAARLTLDGNTYGTPIYMAPEQILGNNIGPACDVYALGVIAYEALAGTPPFMGSSVLEVVSMHLHAEVPSLAVACPAAPRALCELVHQMLQKTAAQRPTAAEVRDAMSALAIDDQVEFESYEVTMTLEPAPIIETDARLRWTPQMPPSIAATLGFARIRTSPEVSNEISAATTRLSQRKIS